jgi:hypothetical protein
MIFHDNMLEMPTPLPIRAFFLSCLVASALAGCRPRDREGADPGSTASSMPRDDELACSRKGVLVSREEDGGSRSLVANTDGEIFGKYFSGRIVRGPCDKTDPHVPCWSRDLDEVRKATLGFVSKNPGRCPTPVQLKSMGFLFETAPTTDPWNREFVIECTGKSVEVCAPGNGGFKGIADELSPSVRWDPDL